MRRLTSGISMPVSKSRDPRAPQGPQRCIRISIIVVMPITAMRRARPARISVEK